MNAHTIIPDVQSTSDTRNIVINKVGIKSVKHPFLIQEPNGTAQRTIGLFNMYVRLPATVKGTHMSRFIEILQNHPNALNASSFQQLISDMLVRLNAEEGEVEVEFPYFITKTAPVSGVQSLLDYQVKLIGKASPTGYESTLQVIVPVTSLCPCSKEISKYGAHNQRSHVTITASVSDGIWIDDLIQLAEKQASCEVYGLLKRPDEKYVTEHAYENPKFVEDMVRDIASQLDNDPRVLRYTVESENFESIHNHSAYALVESAN